MNKQVVAEDPAIPVSETLPDGVEPAGLNQAGFQLDDPQFQGVALSELEIGEFESAPTDWV